MEEITLKRTLTVTGIILSIVLVFVSLILFVTNHANLAKEKTVMAEFKTLMAKEDVTIAEIIKYTDENINAVSKENASSLVNGIERIQQANLPKWQKKFENDAFQRELAKTYRNNSWTLTNLSSIQGSDLKAIVLQTTSNGFKVETAEGYFFPVIDYTFYKKYHDALPPDLAAYIEIMAVESDKTPVKDAALVIDWNEILKRAVRQERFIKEYSSSTQVKAIKELLKRYVTFALFGANNTPLFSYDTNQMMSEAKKAYQKYVWDQENGRFSALMREYLRVLKENDYRLTGKVDAYRKKAVSAF